MASKIVAHLEARVCIFKPKRKRSEWRDAKVEMPELPTALRPRVRVLAVSAQDDEPRELRWDGQRWTFPSGNPYNGFVSGWRPMPRGPKGVAK